MAERDEREESIDLIGEEFEQLDTIKYLKKFTPAQKFKVFEKEVLAFFIKNVPEFVDICQFQLSFYLSNIGQPSGFSGWPLWGDERTRLNDKAQHPFIFLRNKVRNNEDIIMRVGITGTAKVPEEFLEKMFEKYRTSEGTFFSNVLYRNFEIGDQDDVKAVELLDKTDKYWSASNAIVYVWIRSWA